MKLIIFILLLFISLKIASSPNMILLDDSASLTFKKEIVFSFEENLRAQFNYQNNIDRFQEVIISTTSDFNQLFVSIDFDLQLNKSTFTIYNIFGKAVLKGRINEHAFTIDISKLQTGFHILTFIIDTTNRTIMFSRKFLKK